MADSTPAPPERRQPSPEDSQVLAYEPPDAERAASAAPTEGELERESLGAGSRGHDPYAALRFADFRLFSAGALIGVIGHQMLAVAIAWEVFDRTGSKAALGWIAGVQVLPLFLLALPAGQLADTFDRRRIIAIGSFLAGCCSLGLAFLSYRPGSLGWMYLLMGLNSASLVLGRPATSSLIPQIVPPEVFPNAVTWNSSLFQLASMGGPALAGLVIAHSARLAYLVDAAAAFTLSGLMLILCARPLRVLDRRPPAGGRVSELLAGFRFIYQTRILLGTILLDLLAVLLGGAVYLLPVFAKDILRVGQVGFGWLRAAEAIGAFASAMLIAHTPPMKKAGRAMLLAVAGFGVCTIVFGLSRHYWLSFAVLVLLGMFDQISVVVRHTLVQVLTPDHMRGRVAAVNNISIGASNELGGLESGLTATLFGTVRAVVLGGVGTLLTVAAIAAWFPRVRRFGSLQDARPAPQSGSPAK